MEERAKKLQSEVEEEKKEEQNEEVSRIKEDIDSLRGLEAKHQELRAYQSQIHKELQDIWRVRLQAQKEQAEREAKEDESKGNKNKQEDK